MGLFPSPRFLAIILICSPLFFADLIGKAAPPWVGVLVLYCLLSEKETFEKAISHLKTPRGPILQGPIKQRYLKKGTMHLTTLVFWSTKGVSLSPLQTMDAYDSHLQGGEKELSLQPGLPSLWKSCCAAPTAAKAAKKHCKWSKSKVLSTEGKKQKKVSFYSFSACPLQLELLRFISLATAQNHVCIDVKLLVQWVCIGQLLCYSYPSIGFSCNKILNQACPTHGRHMAWPRPSWSCSCPCQVAWPGSGHKPHCSAVIKPRCAISSIWAETRAWGGHNTELAQVMANKFIHCDTVAKHSALNSKKHRVLLSIVRKESEKMFQDCWKKKSILLYSWDFNFSWHKYMICQFSNGRYRVAIRHSTQKSDNVCLPDLYIRLILPEENTPCFIITLIHVAVWKAGMLSSVPSSHTQERHCRLIWGLHTAGHSVVFHRSSTAWNHPHNTQYRSYKVSNFPICSPHDGC